MVYNGVIIDVLDDPDSASFRYKQKITVKTGSNEQKMFKQWYL